MKTKVFVTTLKTKVVEIEIPDDRLALIDSMDAASYNDDCIRYLRLDDLEILENEVLKKTGYLSLENGSSIEAPRICRIENLNEISLLEY